MLTITKIHTIITDLNNKLYEQHEHDEIYLELLTIGNNIFIIKFLGVELWRSDDDERIEIFDDVYEELDVYLIRKIDKLINTIITINVFE